MAETELFHARVKVAVGPLSDVDVVAQVLYAVAREVGLFAFHRSPDNVTVVIIARQAERVFLNALALSDLARMLQAEVVEVEGAQTLTSLV